MIRYFQILLISVFLVSVGCGTLDENARHKIWSVEDQGVDSSSENYPVDSSSASSGIEISTTGVGTLTGAAVGGGIGLVLGSTTGNAGEGLAIGALAGAAAGAGIGNQIQGREEKIAQTKERVTQQTAMLSEQSRQIELLKGQSDYPINDSNGPSLQRRTGSDQYRGRMSQQGSGFDKSQATRIDVSEIEGLATRRPSAPIQPERVASVGSGYQSGNVSTVPQPSLPKLATKSTEASVSKQQKSPVMETSQPVKVVEQSLPVASTNMEQATTLAPAIPPKTALSEVGTLSLPAAKTLPPAKSQVAEDDEETVVGEESLAEVESVENGDANSKTESTVKPSGMPSAKSAVTKPELPVETEVVQETKAPAQETKTESVAKAVSCPDAEQEAVRARSANSDADKLFYFRRAIRLCPEKPEYYVEIGKVYASIGRTEDAQSEFSKALELDPDNSKAQEELNMIMLGAAY